MYKLAIFMAIVAYAHGGVIVPVAHPVVAPVVAHPVAVSHSSSVIHHPPVARLVHAPVYHAPVVHAPVYHAAPLVHAPVVPIVRHAPLIAVHH